MSRTVPNVIAENETPASSTKMNANLAYLCTEIDDLETAAVLNADFNANTILAATSDDTPAAVTVGEQTLVGRITGGNIVALTTTQIKTLLGYIASLGEDTSPELTGTLDASDEKIQDVKTVSFTDEHDNGNSGTTKTIDWSEGQKQKITMTGNCTFTFSNPDVGNYQIKIIQDATGSRSVTWPSIKWAGSTAPTLTTAAGSEDIVSLYYDGSAWYAMASLNFGTPA